VCAHALAEVRPSLLLGLSRWLTVRQWCRTITPDRCRSDSRVTRLTKQFDLTTLSSLNRHACATLEDVGSPKVIAMQRFLQKIAPWAQYAFSPHVRTLHR